MAGLGNSGQTLNDRLNAARYALAGQGLARVVCKATTEEMIAPKKKHIDYLLQCTNEPNVSIPQLANLLIERTTHPNWVVVFKSLVTVHHLMCYGNERFTQYLASSNSNFQLSNYQDKSSNRGYDMSMFIRRYAKYLNTKALSYRTVAFDFTKIKRGGDGQLRAMNVEKLVKTVPMLQTQIDSLLEFDCTASDLTNGVINAAFFLLFKDLIRLFACYNDGIINCLEKYFEMTNKKMARETLEIYKKFLIRMNKVGDFLKTAENVGIDKGEIPDLTKAPSSLLDAMEQHLAQLEGKKPGTTTTSNGENTEVSAKKAIEEEEQFLNKLKEKHVADKKPAAGGSSAPVSNPFLAMAASPTADASKGGKSSDIIDLFGTEVASGNAAATVSKSPAEDLFSLSSGAAPATGEAASSNPFADILNAMGPVAGQTVSSNAAVPGNNFATSDNFAAAFGSSSTSNLANSAIPKGFDAFGDVLQPMNVSSLGAGPPSTTTPAVPIITTPVPSSVSSQSLLKGDLDASLASLAQNLDINGPKGAGFKNRGQFNQSPKSMMKTGTPMVSSTSTPAISSAAGMWTHMPMGAAGATGMPPTAQTGLAWAANPGGVVGPPQAGSLNWPLATSSTGNAAMMPMMGAMQPSPAMVMPSVSPSMPLGFGMRPPSMIPGAVSVLPAGVTPATLSSALNSRLSTGTSSTAAATTSTTLGSQMSDPFGAL